ncbi:MAG: C25 family cysteine peptidase [Candidatus Promineifilaceae bacterium]
MQHQLFFRRSTYSFILLALIVVMGYTQTRAAETPRANETHATINQSTAEVLQFDLHVAPVTFESSGALSIAGLEGRIADTGAPQLPFYRTLIGLPPEAEVTVSVVSNQSSKTDEVLVQPVPSVDIPDDVDRRSITSLEAFDLLYEEDAAIYESNQAYPNELFEVSEPFYIRDRRVVELTIYPVRHNPVAQSLLAHHSLSISVAFEGGNMRGMQPVSSTSDAFGISILNGTQSAEWRARPRGLSTATSFPIGVETVKIEVNEDAIYELTRTDLVTINSIANGDPSTFQMMHQGEPVAFEFVGDTDSQFESGESIRFYGWAFDGTRAEKLHVENNVFWLWAGDAAASLQMNTTPNLGNGGTVLNSWESTVAFEENNYYLETNKQDWSNSDADAELWYWKFFRDREITEFNLNLPHPTGAGNATYTSEIFASIPTNNPGVTQHGITTTLNSVAGSTLTWTENELKIISSNISGAQLVPGINVLRLHSNSSRTNNFIRDDFHLNRITVTYDRAFAAVGNQLQFEIPAAGTHEVTVTNLSGVTAGAEVSVYDVTNRLTPTQINVVGDVDIATSSSVRIGRENAANARLIAGKPKSPLSTSVYMAETLEPSGGQGASWVIVAPEIFNATAQDLATHRASHSGMSTFVADYEDIINQYGYGLEYPTALRSYFTHGLMTWANALEYVVLAGDATNNPLKRDCNKNSADPSICPGLANTNWQDVNDINHIVTDYQFVDEIVGAVPTDFSMTLLQNDSLTNHIADIMLGRLPAQTNAELSNIVKKIALYENHLTANSDHTNRMLWIADDADLAGDFCADTTLVRDQYIPTGRFTHKTFCLDDYGGNTTTAKNTMRSLFLNEFNAGASMINYRGHGAVRNWGQDLIDPVDLSGLINFTKPSVIISADCLDGYFTSMGEEALSELFISGNGGSAAHWSSVGLGFNSDHTKLHKAFYTGLYEHNLSTIGAAIQYAKEDFISNDSSKDAEVYEFLLQGDPAMQLPGVQHNAYIPIVLR